MPESTCSSQHLTIGSVCFQCNDIPSMIHESQYIIYEVYNMYLRLYQYCQK